MKAKLVKENIDFERGQEPRDAMKVGISGSGKNPKEVIEDLLVDVYFDYIDKQRGNYQGFGQWIADQIIELFKSPTYGDYDPEDALQDLNYFLEGWQTKMNLRGRKIRGLIK